MPVLALLLSSILLVQPAPVEPKLTAELLADHAAIVPGGQVELALKLTIESGWHVYHPVSLGPGLPTSVDFEVPPGAQIGDLRWPAPTLGEFQGTEYLGYEDSAIILATLRLAENAGPDPLPIVAQVRALACKELCVPLERRATLTLPVAREPAAATHAELFEEARAALPEPLDKSEYIAGSRLAVSHTKLPIGGQGVLAAVIRVKSGYHIQDRDPGVEGLIPSRLFIESRPGIQFDASRQVWPRPHVEETPGVGKVRVQKGELVIQAPFQLNDAKFKPGPVRLRVLFYYQCCLDGGECYPPKMTESFVEFEVLPAGQEAVQSDDPIFAKLVTMAPPVPPPGDAASPAGDSSAAAPAATGSGQGLIYMILLGFIGGMILNITPCVFPVISIKVIGFVKQAGEDRGRVLRLGLVFCAGILVWFWIFAALTSIGHIPWQHPPVVIGLTVVLFVFALNLFGVFEIILPGSATGRLDEVSDREGYPGAFLKGLLATLLGTACTAPFFATAAAFAATQPASIAFAIFTSAGLGMSAPYVVLAAYPAWLRLLPRPGPWMVTFKQAMGFVLIGTAVWLLLTVGDLLDARGVVWTVGFCAFVGFALWLIGKIKLNWSFVARLNTWLAALAIAALGWWFCFVYMYNWRATAQNPQGGAVAGENGVDYSGDLGQTAERVVAAVASSDWNGHIPWQKYRSGLAEELSRRGYTVYIDYTATWCVTCQSNKAVALEIDSMRAKMRAMNVIPIKADYTKMDAAMRRDLLKFGHNSVPLNLIYPAGHPEKVIHLPVILTPGIVRDALDQAGPSLAGAPATTQPGS